MDKQVSGLAPASCPLHALDKTSHILLFCHSVSLGNLYLLFFALMQVCANVYETWELLCFVFASYHQDKNASLMVKNTLLMTCLSLRFPRAVVRSCPCSDIVFWLLLPSTAPHLPQTPCEVGAIYPILIHPLDENELIILGY